MNLFGYSKPVTEEQQQAAVIELRDLLSRTQDSQPSVEDLLRKGGEPGLIGDGLDDLTLSRWLRAENCDTKKVETRLRDHAKWRAEYVPNGRITEEEVKTELETGKAFVQGFDKLGRPLIVATAQKHSRSIRNLEETKRFICYTLDTALRSNDAELNPDGKLCSIFDLRGMKMDSVDAAVLRAIFDLLGNHYPERLGKLWMLDAPGIFIAIWKVVSPFIDSVTKSKIEFVHGDEAIETFRAAISPEVLPKGLGGDADLHPVQKVAEEFATSEATNL